ncbi:hypothetical protein HPB48_011164 [Haemaphysalis longicornis]|uniref:Uncharacterized protein n=1 Tax=Haemaphysalis longicornis TaxID=44386 RepID=A0A9J6GX65_HAELO|nr:hypothetical protein HPB48_011164 [Haemaphysalis longicornis]
MRPHQYNGLSTAARVQRYSERGGQNFAPYHAPDQTRLSDWSSRRHHVIVTPHHFPLELGEGVLFLPPSSRRVGCYGGVRVVSGCSWPNHERARAGDGVTDMAAVTSRRVRTLKAVGYVFYPVFVVFCMLRWLLSKVVLVLWFVFRGVWRSHTESHLTAAQDTSIMAAASGEPDANLLIRQKQHHKKAFDFISKALKYDEENDVNARCRDKFPASFCSFFGPSRLASSLWASFGVARASAWATPTGYSGGRVLMVLLLSAFFHSYE